MGSGDSQPILVSACLAGVRCRYDGTDKLRPEIAEAVDAGDAITGCPEMLGGMNSPRRPAEIRGGSAEDVLDGHACVIDDRGEDVTDAYVQGAYRMLALARSAGVDRAILQDRSPSCGSSHRYDGTFSGHLVDGTGVTAALLTRHGITISPPDKTPTTQAPDNS